jgi:hypothetical protein
MFQHTNRLCRSHGFRSPVFSLHPLERVGYGPPLYFLLYSNPIYLVAFDEGTRVLVSSLDELLMRIIELACTLLYNAGLSSPFFGMLAPPLLLPIPACFIFLTHFSVRMFIGAIECRFLVYVLFVSVVVLASEVCSFLFYILSLLFSSIRS